MKGIPLYSSVGLKRVKKSNAGLFMIERKGKEFWQNTPLDQSHNIHMKQLFVHGLQSIQSKELSHGRKAIFTRVFAGPRRRCPVLSNQTYTVQPDTESGRTCAFDGPH